MALDYQKELLRLEDLDRSELQNDQILISLRNNEESNEFQVKESTIFQNQISLLKEKNDHYKSIVNKLETLVQTYIKPMNMSPHFPVVNVEGLEDNQDNTTTFYAEKQIGELENEMHGKDLEDYIDKLNNNIELIKKAFNQNISESEKNNFEENTSEIEESTTNPELEDKFDETLKRKKEKSLLNLPSDINNEAHRKFHSINMMNKVNVGYALENSSLSISILNKKLRAYPDRIQSLEEEIKQMIMIIANNNEKLENLQKTEVLLKEDLKQKEEKIEKLEEKNKAMEAEIKEKTDKLIIQSNELEKAKTKEKDVIMMEEKSSNNHYENENPLAILEKQKQKDGKIETSQKNDCCTIF